MNTSVAMALLATFTVGSAVGGAVGHFVTIAQVTCIAPAPAKETASDDAMKKLLQPTQIPLTGYRSY